MAQIGANLALLLAAWSDWVRAGSADGFAAILDEEAVWQGLRPDLVCHGREEVLDVMFRDRGRAPRLTRIEAAEDGDRVVVSVESPDLQGSGDDPHSPLLPPGVPRTLAFTFRDRRVVRVDSVLPDATAGAGRLS